MRISAVNNFYPKMTFKSSGNSEYENPINRSTERNLAIWGSLGASTLAGLTSAGITSCFIENGAKHRSKILTGIGTLVGLTTLALSLPAKLYDTKVKAFTREKEMDVFTRDRELKSNIMAEVNEEIKDEDVSLDQKINHYTTVQMANNGKGLLVKGA